MQSASIFRARDKQAAKMNEVQIREFLTLYNGIRNFNKAENAEGAKFLLKRLNEDIEALKKEIFG